MPVTRGGARLAFVVVKIDHDVEREVCEYVDPKKVKAVHRPDGQRRRRTKSQSGVVRRTIKQPGGYLVYFPRGHVLRFRDEDHLAQYHLDGDAPIINMTGLESPNSPVGKLFRAQDAEARRLAYEGLEKHVIQLATVRSGPVIMPEQLQSRRAVAEQVEA